MRRGEFKIGSTDAVHIYSDDATIWLQLRRDVPTEQSIAKPSFKTALMLSREQAIAIAGELLTAATRKSSQTNGVDNLPPRKPQSSKPITK